MLINFILSDVVCFFSNLCCYRAGKRSKKKYKRRTENAALNKWIQSFKKDWSSVNSPFTLEAFGCVSIIYPSYVKSFLLLNVSSVDLV